MNGSAGSALLIVIIATALIVICATNSWHSASCSAHVTLAQQQFVQRLYATQGLLMIGKALCKNNEKQVFSDGFSSTLSVDKWQCGDDFCAGKLSIRFEAEKVVLIKALLFNQEKPFFSISCRILNAAPGQNVVHDWTIHAC